MRMVINTNKSISPIYMYTYMHGHIYHCAADQPVGKGLRLHARVRIRNPRDKHSVSQITCELVPDIGWSQLRVDCCCPKPVCLSMGDIPPHLLRKTIMSLFGSIDMFTKQQMNANYDFQVAATSVCTEGSVEILCQCAGTKSSTASRCVDALSPSNRSRPAVTSAHVSGG